MAIKTFTAGSVLTAADTNTYLANSGLVLVKSQTVGTGVSSVNVTSAFSTDYDNYRILYTNGLSSAGAIGISMKLGTLTAGYYSGVVNVSYNTALVTGTGQDNQAIWNNVGGSGAANYVIFDADVYAPFLSRWTFFASRGIHFAFTFSTANGLNTSTSSITDFTLQPASGTLTGGTITVYGYRKA
jgi:hypothetical protein